MKMTLTEKLIFSHLVCGEMARGAEIGLRIDQTLTQDATGTMAYLQLEAIGVGRVKTELSVAYIDHQLIQAGFMNADDHRFIQSAARKHGVFFSKAGNGICHQVHLERFGRPGKTLIGSDSHTPTAGALGMLSFGAGGLNVAAAMAGEPYYIRMPKIIRVDLTGALSPGVSAKDVSLELLRILSVKGGVGAVLEFHGPGVKTLSISDRATICNMATETGATTSVFPSDEITLDFLKKEQRSNVYLPLDADEGSDYDQTISIDLSALEPLVACPHMPDKVVTVASLEGLKIDQVAVGSCTNSSLSDLFKTTKILEGRTVHPSVSMAIAPGSKQVLTMIAENGLLSSLLSSGARILECGCGPCIGMGFSPNSGGVSLRTFNRNFLGRSGTQDASVYLVSPETAAASAAAGSLTDPRPYCQNLRFSLPESFRIDDRMILAPLPESEAASAAIQYGPNIKPFPKGSPVPDMLKAAVSIKVGDHITTDHIMPAGSRILPYRSNIPMLSSYCFESVDPDFPERAKELGTSIIIAGLNYGQGSSREHAALAPLFLGVRAVIAKSFARIHRSNLINNGILPLCFHDPDDYDLIKEGDVLKLTEIHAGLATGRIMMEADGRSIRLDAAFSQREAAYLRKGGLLNYTKEPSDGTQH